MNAKVDDIRPKGTVQVTCDAVGCDWEFWVTALDDRLPNGPFFCTDHETDPRRRPTGEKAEG